MNRTRKSWTVEEDSLLRNLVNEELKNLRPVLWRELAKHVPGRSNKDCRKRWWNSLAGGIVKGPWSQEEDKRLIEAVRAHGTNWNQVASVVGSRYADQCSSHWSQVLNPDINHCDWTAQEDEHLLHAVLTFGTNWSTIATSHIPQRTTLALKNRYTMLRLRHRNASSSKKSSSAQAPSALAKGIINTTKTKKNIQKERFDGNNSAENGAGDQVGEKEEDRDDEDEEEGDVDKNESGRSLPSLSTDKSSLEVLELSYSKAAPHSKSNMAITTDMWAGHIRALPSKVQASYDPPETSAKQWIDSMMDQTICASTNTQLYPSEDFLNATQDGSGVDVSMSFAEHGEDEDSMNIDFSNFQGMLSPESDLPNDNQNYLSGDYVPPVPSLTHSDVVALMPESLVDTKSPVREASIKPTESVLHQVSISLACTTEQLSKIMAWLADTGIAVKIKIDTA